MSLDRNDTRIEKMAIGLLEAVLFPPIGLVCMVALLPLTLFYCWCDLHIWNWFVAPNLGLPVMTVWGCFGLHAFLSLGRSPTVIKDQTILFWRSQLTSLSMHTGALALGYGVHRWLS